MKLRTISALISIALVAAMAIPANAGPVYQPPGANLTYGDVTHGQRVLSAAGNPAAAAADLTRGGDEAARGMVVSAVAGVEYGNIQELYDRLDELSRAFAPSPPGDGGGPGQDPDPPDDGISIGDIIDICCPDFREIIDAAKAEFTMRLKLLAFLELEVYAKGFASLDIPVIIGREVLGGAWTFGFNWAAESKIYGVTRPIEFDPDAALADLQSQYNLSPGDPATLFDIAGDVDIIIDPGPGDVRIRMDSDNLLLTKASKTTEIAAGYSRLASSTERGDLFLGVEAKYYALDLTRLGVRFGDITDSEELFKSIENSEFVRDSSFGFDIGALWIGGNYQLGATLTNVNEPSFDYPELDTSFYRDGTIIDFLRTDKTYTMERQLKLEGSWFSPNRRWTANLGVDANAVLDPVGDDFQWATVSGGFQSDSRWLQSLRIGYRRNLAGTEKTYVSAGVTAFRYFNFDIASSVETVSVSGDKLPEGVILSLGFQVTF
jgi:hypothetical protein